MADEVEARQIVAAPRPHHQPFTRHCAKGLCPAPLRLMPASAIPRSEQERPAPPMETLTEPLNRQAVTPGLDLDGLDQVLGIHSGPLTPAERDQLCQLVIKVHLSAPNRI
ncbi:MAG: hypothetical protein K2X68_07210 [Novosphingobium sp.]|nr:hypothetical protein [Novosphingobium sp.]